jgi:glucuronoarabinoxylan endo-1,4-beta-xylanase
MYIPEKKHQFIVFNYLLAFIAIAVSISCSKSSGTTNTGNNNTNTVNSEITISANDTNQIIEGFGCATVFKPSSTSLSNDELDRLFGNGSNQLGLNILRIRVATDSWWRSIELTNAKGAIQRGAKVLATPWSPPASMKTNNNLIGGSLNIDSSAAYATYLNDFANYMSANGAPLYVISIQNEPDITVSYESCSWTDIGMRDFLKNYGQLITKTRVMAPESFNNNQTFAATLLSDNGAAANISIIGSHIYGGGVVENVQAKALGKEVWMTEHLDTLTTYAANLNTAIEMHNCLTKANFSAYIWWYGKRFYGPIGEDGFITKRGYIMSQFAKFIMPGAIRIGTSVNTNSGVLISAYKNPNGKKTIVAINNTDINVNQKITISSATTGNVIPYTTTSSINVTQGNTVTVSNNSFTYTMEPNSITTFVEQ